MMQTPMGDSMYQYFMTLPQENGIDSARKASMFCQYYFREMYYDSINPIDIDSITDMCFNRHFEEDSLSDIHLTGFDIFDGLRGQFEPFKQGYPVNPNNPVAQNYFIPLPENAYPGFNYDNTD